MTNKIHNLAVIDETAKIGKGGLTLYNFPVYLNEEGKNQGILLRLQVRSEGTWNFNSHYKWEPSAQTFVLTQNENLVDYIYFRVYGLDINIEAVGQDVQGFKDNQVKLIDNTNGIFKFVVKAFIIPKEDANKSITTIMRI